MRVRVILSLVLALMPLCVYAASEGVGAATITPSGGILFEDGTTVPPFLKPGRWTEFEGKSNERYETRHFVCLVPGGSPAIELYIAASRNADPPDGVFEVGLVRGFLSGFAGKASLRFSEPIFEQQRIGLTTVTRTMVKLSDARRALWVYAYIYPRRPSLTFIAIRATDDVQQGIETYLQSLEMR
jgi:hypothetical protein